MEDDIHQPPTPRDSPRPSPKLTPKKHVTLPGNEAGVSRDLHALKDYNTSPCGSPSRRRSRTNEEVKCNPFCPGHRKQSYCERLDPDSPRPIRHDDVTRRQDDVTKRNNDEDTKRQDSSDSPRPQRHCDSHQPRSQSSEILEREKSPSTLIVKQLHELVDAATEGGLGTRQYHSASHIAVLKHKDNDLTSTRGIKHRDFSMTYITDRPLTEKELRLVPLKPRSGSPSRTGSPLRTIRHSVRIERWEVITDGELNVENMMKKFDLTGFSHNTLEMKAGELLVCEISPDLKKAGLVNGKVWVKMFGRRINLLLGDILEIPPNQAHKIVAEEGEDVMLVIGHKEGCCIT